MKFVLRVLVAGAAIWVAAWMVPGIELGGAEWTDQALTAVIVGAIFGVINAVIGPIVKLFALPLLLLTLGLFTFVINALLLWFTAWLAGELGLDFAVDGFLAALLGALVVSIVSVGLNMVLRRD